MWILYRYFDAFMQTFQCSYEKRCFMILHSSVLTHPRWSEIVCYPEVRNSLLVDLVQKLSKSVVYWHVFKDHSVLFQYYTTTTAASLTGLFFPEILHIRSGPPKSLPKKNLWGLLMPDFLQAECPSCHPTNSVKLLILICWIVNISVLKRGLVMELLNAAHGKRTRVHMA